MNWKKRAVQFALIGCMMLQMISPAAGAVGDIDIEDENETISYEDIQKYTGVTQKNAEESDADETEEDDKVVIVLDPGHGGSASGATRTWNGTTILEKDLNLTIAKYCKAELESRYKNVVVYMTRTGDEELSLVERAEYAASVDADILVSLHNNAAGDAQTAVTGAEILVPNGNYRPDLAEQAELVGGEILEKLCELGLENRGFLLRDSEENTYPDGSVADYYGVIRNSILLGIPAIIVEHAFMDSDSDYKNYLSTDAKLKALGVADAEGIAEAYGLEEKRSAAENGDAPFTDVYDTAWYYDAVVEAYQKGVTSGVSETRFGPSIVCTRAQVVTFLWNMSGQPVVTDDNPFQDVDEDDWYYEAVKWAASQGITAGTSADTFDPTDSITREQFATLLYNYDGAAEVNGELAFSDADEVSDWAAAAMLWANQQGILNGREQSDGSVLLAPKAGATRAEAAAILVAYLDRE